MTNRRKKYTPPDGLDWRDPDMPVVRDYTMADGRKMKPEISPEFEQGFAQHKLDNWSDAMPNWRQDPTYYSKRNPKNVR